MPALPSLRRIVASLAVVAWIAACGEPREPREAPRPLDEEPSAPAAGAPAAGPGLPAGADPAGSAPADPRLLLFDVQTGIEAVGSVQGEYPVTDAFLHEEAWRLQRERLDAAFDEWSYRSDGASYELSGSVGERAWEVRGP